MMGRQRDASASSKSVDPFKPRRVKTASSCISRRARRGVHATVKEVLTQAIAASNHWRIIRNGAAQHF
jgi:hypothetical protein